MATISENLQIIADSTAAIKQAIIDKGGDASGDITTWASAISGLSGGGGSDNLKTFSFTTADISAPRSRVYIDGMTWGEWIDSIYNTNDTFGVFRKTSDTSPIFCALGEVYKSIDGSAAALIFASQLISDSITYIISSQAGDN